MVLVVWNQTLAQHAYLGNKATKRLLLLLFRVSMQNILHKSSFLLCCQQQHESLNGKMNTLGLR